jgi:hypothetical protein
MSTAIPASHIQRKPELLGQTLVVMDLARGGPQALRTSAGELSLNVQESGSDFGRDYRRRYGNSAYVSEQ